MYYTSIDYNTKLHFVKTQLPRSLHQRLRIRHPRCNWTKETTTQTKARLSKDQPSNLSELLDHKRFVWGFCFSFIVTCQRCFSGITSALIDAISSMIKVRNAISSKYSLSVTNGIHSTLTIGNKHINIDVWVCVLCSCKKLKLYVPQKILLIHIIFTQRMKTSNVMTDVK